MFLIRTRQRGFSLVELVAVMAMAGLLFSMALLDARSYGNTSLNAASNLMGFFKTVRAKALATTQAYTIRAASATSITTTFGSTCASMTQTADPQLTFTLPNGAVMSDTSWIFCYSTRGLADTSLNIIISDGSAAHTVQLVLGGAVRVI